MLTLKEKVRLQSICQSLKTSARLATPETTINLHLEYAKEIAHLGEVAVRTIEEDSRTINSLRKQLQQAQDSLSRIKYPDTTGQ